MMNKKGKNLFINEELYFLFSFLLFIWFLIDDIIPFCILIKENIHFGMKKKIKMNIFLV